MELCLEFPSASRTKLKERESKTTKVQFNVALVDLMKNMESLFLQEEMIKLSRSTNSQVNLRKCGIRASRNIAIPKQTATQEGD